MKWEGGREKEVKKKILRESEQQAKEKNSAAAFKKDKRSKFTYFSKKM